MNWAEKLGLDPVPVPEPEPEEKPVTEAAFDPIQTQELARKSLDFLAALSMPTVFRYFFPTVYQSIWHLLVTHVHKERDFSRLAIGLPRGFAKTTFIKIFLLYVILFTKRQFILVCAHSKEKAEAIVSDVCDFLDEPNIKAVFGDWRIGIESDNVKLKKFGFRGRNIVIAAGTVETVRGLNLKHQRPDVMLFDDIQSRQDADSEVVSKQLETDLLGTAMKAKSPHGCLFIFLANMYPTKWSLLRRLKKDPTWIKFIAGGILADGTSLWEELQPINQLLVEFQSDLAAGRPEVFYAEVLNDENASVNAFVDLSKLPENPYEDDDMPQGSFIIIDPATDKANADAVTIAYAEVFDRKPVYKEILEGRFSHGEICRQAIGLALKRNCHVIGIESNAFQYVLCGIMEEKLLEMGIEGIHVVEVYSGKRSKNSRILDMFKSLMAGEIYFTQNVKAAITSQIVGFNHLRTDNVDGVLDCLTYGPKMIELYEPLIGSVYENLLAEDLAIPVLSVSHTTGF